MMRRTLATTAARTGSATPVWSRALGTSTVLQAAHKIRAGDIDPAKFDPFAGIDIRSSSEDDPNAGVHFQTFLKQKFKERKGYPHPFDELDPTDEPFKPKKAQFPF